MILPRLLHATFVLLFMLSALAVKHNHSITATNHRKLKKSSGKKNFDNPKRHKDVASGRYDYHPSKMSKSNKSSHNMNAGGELIDTKNVHNHDSPTCPPVIPPTCPPVSHAPMLEPSKTPEVTMKPSTTAPAPFLLPPTFKPTRSSIKPPQTESPVAAAEPSVTPVAIDPPSLAPDVVITAKPSDATDEPSESPETESPSSSTPSHEPSESPVEMTSMLPSEVPSKSPSLAPTIMRDPTVQPTESPETKFPSSSPSTNEPSETPIDGSPSAVPSDKPSESPMDVTPSRAPGSDITLMPSDEPTASSVDDSPSSVPSDAPSPNPDPTDSLSDDVLGIDDDIFALPSPDPSGSLVNDDIAPGDDTPLGDDIFRQIEVELTPFQLAYSRNDTAQSLDMNRIFRVTRTHLSRGLAELSTSFRTLELFPLLQNERNGISMDQGTSVNISYAGSAFFFDDTVPRDRIDEVTLLAFMGDNLTAYSQMLMDSKLSISRTEFLSPLEFSNGSLYAERQNSKLGETTATTPSWVYVLAIGVPLILLACVIWRLFRGNVSLFNTNSPIHDHEEMNEALFDSKQPNLDHEEMNEALHHHFDKDDDVEDYDDTLYRR